MEWNQTHYHIQQSIINEEEKKESNIFIFDKLISDFTPTPKISKTNVFKFPTLGKHDTLDSKTDRIFEVAKDKDESNYTLNKKNLFENLIFDFSTNDSADNNYKHIQEVEPSLLIRGEASLESQINKKIENNFKKNINQPSP